MKLLLSTYALNGFPLRDSFLLAKKLGFDGLELVLMPSHVLAGPKRVRELAAKYGLPVLSVHQPMWHWPYTTKGMLRRLSQFTKSVGAETAVVHFSGLRFQRPEKIFPFIRSLEASSGVTLALENSKRRGSDLAPKWCWEQNSLAALSSRFGLNLTLDVPKLALSGGDSSSFFKNFEHQISNIHLHGSKKSKIHRPLASSDIDYRPFVKNLGESNYCKLLTFEIFPRRSGARSQDEVKEIIGRDLKLVLSYSNDWSKEGKD